jgi:GT2 family glycosyltransferase
LWGGLLSVENRSARSAAAGCIAAPHFGIGVFTQTHQRPVRSKTRRVAHRVEAILAIYIWYWHDSRSGGYSSVLASGEQRLKMSVVIPCQNSAADLAHCLAALAVINRPATEYIVIDDGSAEDISVAVSGLDLPVHFIRLEQFSGAAAARNRGARVATGEVLVFLDSDVCVHPDTLDLIESAFAEPNAPDAVIGSYDDHPSASGFHSQFRNLLHHHVHQHSARDICTFWTGCGAVRRAVFERHYGFTEEIAGMDDIEFGGRVTSGGGRIELRREIQVQHRKRWTLFSWAATDLILRGIPWTLLLLRDGSMPNVLNVGYRSRASVALIGAAAIASLAALKVPGLAWAALASVAAFAWLNRGLYAFFVRKRGPLFAAGSVIAHAFHCCVCGIAFVSGAILFAVSPDARRSTRRPIAPQPGILREPNG